MSLTTLFTLQRKKKSKKNNCPYKVEPSCGILSGIHWDLSVKPSTEGSKQGMKENIRRGLVRLKMLLLSVILMLLLTCLTGSGGKGILLKEGEIKALPSGNYEVSPSWMEERLNFENDMVKRLQECNSN